MTAKRQTKKSLIDQIVKTGFTATDAAEAIHNGTYATYAEYLATLKMADVRAHLDAALEWQTDDTEAVGTGLFDTTLSDTAEKLSQAVSAIIAEEKQDLAEAQAERETVSIEDVMDAAAETYEAERQEAAEALFGETTAAALKRANELQAHGSPLALTPAGKYVRTFNVEGAYVTNDGHWIAVKDEKGAAEKKPWTLYEVAGGALRDVGHFKSSATAFDPAVEVFAAGIAKQAAA